MTSKFVALQGGLDLVTPPLKVGAGAAIETLNYYESVKGGYTRIAGYERFDGRLSPADATYHYIHIADWNLRATPTPFVIGDPLVVGTATLTILSFLVSTDGTYCDVVGGELIGDVPDDLEDNPVVFDTNCSITSAVYQGAESDEANVAFLNQARDYRRALIATPAGTGSIRGVLQIKGEAIAWRDDGTGKLLAYKASASGWQVVDYAQMVVCAATTAPVRGDVCNSATQTILGAFEYLDAAGAPVASKQILAVHNTTGVALLVTDTLTRDSDTAVIGALQELLPYQFNSGGRVRPLIHNFYASASTRYGYFADGVNMAGVYKPTYNCIQPIATNYRLMDDVFTHVHAHNNKLWFATSYGTALTSVVDEPEVIDGFLGSTEWGAGDTITGFVSTGADMLHTFTEKTVQALSGIDIASFHKYIVSDTVGSKSDMIVSLDDTFSLSNRGISSLKRSNSLGGFDAATVSDDIQPLMRELNKLAATASVVVRGLNQMRFYFGNRFLMLSRVTYNANGNEGVRYGITEGSYNVQVACIDNGDDVNGDERILFGGDDGLVYQADKGTSFDGDSIVSTLTLHPNHLGSPQMRKRFRAVDWEANANSAVTLRMYYNMNEGNKSFLAKDLSMQGGAVGWDEAQYDQALYDTNPLSRKTVKLVGTGHNVEFSFYHSDANTASFTLTGYTLRYSNRGLTR